MLPLVIGYLYAMGAIGWWGFLWWVDKKKELPWWKELQFVLLWPVFGAVVLLIALYNVIFKKECNADTSDHT